MTDTNIEPQEPQETMAIQIIPSLEDEDATKKEKSNHWQNIIRDFQTLGQSLVSAIKDILPGDKDKQTEQVNEFRDSLENMVNQVVKSIDNAVNSPKVDGVKSEMGKAVKDVKGVGDKVYTESRPQVIKALQTLRDGVQTLIERLEESTTSEKTSSPPPEAKVEEVKPEEPKETNRS